MSTTSERNLFVPTAELNAFCGRNHIRKLSLFGSVLRDDFTERSDVDVLVEFEPGEHPGLMAKAGLREELSGLLGREVDLRVPKELSQYFRQRVLDEAEVICVRG